MMGHAGRLTAAATLAVGLCVGTFAPQTAHAQDADKVRNLYDEGMKALQQGKYEDALGKFKALFQEDPNETQVLDLIRSTETKHFLSMLSKGGDYELAAKRLLELGHRSIEERSRDQERIGALVRVAIRENDLQKRREASRTLMAEHGAYAVPALVGYLGSNDTDERVRAIMVLEDIGIEAVLPLIEVLNSPDARVRENVVVTLRRILDPRAYPLLEWIASDQEQPGSVRRAAGQALDAYKAYTGSSAGSVEDALLEVARAYYQKHPDVIRDLGGSYSLWSWSEGGLVYQDCPKMMYHLRLAEKACSLAIKKDPTSEKARSMLSIVLAAQKVALANASEEFLASEAGQAEAGRLALADAAITSGGVQMMNRALLMSLEWEDSSVARAILTGLPTFGASVPMDAESGLVAALASPDQTVQWAAAMAAAKLAPRETFPRCDLVVPLLADAAALGSVRQVLVIEPATKTAVQLQTELNGAGMHAVVARNGAQGLIRSKQVPFDAVLVSADLTDMLANQVVNEIRRDVRTANVPVLVIASEAQAEAQASMFGDAIAGVVTLPASAKVYVPQVKEAASASPLDDRARALATSEMACDLIANASDRTCYDFTMAEKALAGTLSTDKPDAIKLKALAGLDRWGSDDSLAALTDSLGNSSNSEAVRAESARVMGTILTGKAPSKQCYDALVAGLNAGSLAVRNACAGALGTAGLTDMQRAEVLNRSAGM